jgi:parvulin-like peptidyl-prolyl isomerase
MIARAIVLSLASCSVAWSQPVARLDSVSVEQSQLQEALMSAYGLEMTIKLMQLEIARAEARALGAGVGRAEIDAERRSMLEGMFPEVDTADTTASAAEFEQLLEQLLQQQGGTPTEFDLIVQTNAHLRAIVLPALRKQITEQNVEEAFGLLHGEKVRVRHIALANLQEVAEAQRRLAAGEAFEKVAREMSRSPRSASLGGELAPFARSSAGISGAFSQVAFALEPGQVSDPVQYEGLFHLIKLEEKIEPKAVKLEDVRDSVRQTLENSLANDAMRRLRNELNQRILRDLQIDDPVLRKQFEARTAASRQGVDRDAILERLR